MGHSVVAAYFEYINTHRWSRVLSLQTLPQGAVRNPMPQGRTTIGGHSSMSLLTLDEEVRGCEVWCWFGCFLPSKPARARGIILG